MAFNLRGFLSLDGSGFDRSIERAQQKSNAFAKSTQSSLGKMFTGAAVIAGIKFVNDKLTELQTRATEIMQGSSRSGLDPTTYQQFDNVLKATGMSADRAFNSMERLAEAVDKVKRGNDAGGELAKSFAQFGVTMDDLKRKEYQAIFFQIADAMKGMDIDSKNMKMIGDLLGGKAGDLVAAMKIGFNGPVANHGLLDEKDLDQLQRLKKIGEEARGPWKALFQELLLGVAKTKEAFLTVGSVMLSPNATGSGNNILGNVLQDRLNAAKQERAQREAEAAQQRQISAEREAEANKIASALTARKAELEQSIAAERFSLLANEQKLYVLERQAEVLKAMRENLNPNSGEAMELKLMQLQNMGKRKSLQESMAGATEGSGFTHHANLNHLQQIGAAVNQNPITSRVENAVTQTAANTAKMAAKMDEMARRTMPSMDSGVHFG